MAAGRGPAIVENRAALEVYEAHGDAGGAQSIEFGGRGCLLVDADQGTHVDTEPSCGHGGVGDSATELPTALVVGCDIARGRADDDECRPFGRAYTRTVYFYELSEADDEILANLLLAHDAEYDEAEFLELVLEARQAVLTSFEEELLIDAIANELERKQGFVHVEANLRAAVRVSVEEDENVVVPVDERAAAMPTEEEDFRTMLVEVESEDRPYRD